MSEHTPDRRRFYFSLHSLFLFVTGAAVVCAALVWYLKRPTFEINGKISASDVNAICNVIAASPQLHYKHILSITVTGPDEVEVWTGEVRGPLDGGGQTVTLKKQNGVWTIGDVSFWVS